MNVHRNPDYHMTRRQIPKQVDAPFQGKRNPLNSVMNNQCLLDFFFFFFKEGFPEELLLDSESLIFCSFTPQPSPERGVQHSSVSSGSLAHCGMFNYNCNLLKIFVSCSAFGMQKMCVTTSIFQICQNKLRKMLGSPLAKCLLPFQGSKSYL